MDVFFVISGFLISSILFFQLEKDSFSFWNFYSRRIRRIYPALITVLIACLGIGWFFPNINAFFQDTFFLANSEFAQLGKHVAGGAGFISNILLWFESGYFDNAAETKPLLHLWSLGIEEQFYILWPLLLWLAWKKRFNLFSVTALIAFVSVCLNLYWHKTKPILDFFSPQTRFWELLCGAMLAWAHLHFQQSMAPLKDKINDLLHFDSAKINKNLLSHVLSLFGMTLLMATFFFTKGHGFPGKWALLPVLASILIIASGKKGWFNHWILSNPILVWLGKISYPFYLWHWPLLSMARLITRKPLPLWYCITAFPVCVLLAWLTTQFIENPLRFGTFSAIKTSALFVVMLCLGFTGLVIFKQDGSFLKLPQPLKTWDKILQKNFKNNKAWTDEYRHYKKGSLQSLVKPSLIIWGDSHAAALSPGLVTHFGNRYHIQFRETGICPPIFDITKGNQESVPSCIKDNQRVLQEISENKPQIVILGAAWHAHYYLYKNTYQKLEKTITQLQQAGISHIIVVGPFPTWQDKLPLLLIKDYLQTGQISTRLPSEEHAKLLQIDQDMEALSKKWNVAYLSPAKILCDDKTCLTTANQKPESTLVFDLHHLTDAGSEYVVSFFKGHPIFKETSK